MARVLVTRRLPGGLDPLVEAGHELIEPEGDRPFTHDEVVEQAGCQVFLDEQVAPLIDGRTLDAVPTQGDRYQFAFVI